MTNYAPYTPAFLEAQLCDGSDKNSVKAILI